jgi:hypothetical protein
MTIAMSESSVGSSSEVNSSISFATTENIGEKFEELDEIMRNLDIGEAMDHLNLDQKTSPPETAVSMATYTRYVSSLLKQWKKTMT